MNIELMFSCFILEMIGSYLRKCMPIHIYDQYFRKHEISNVNIIYFQY